MFSIAYVILPFSDTPPAEAIRGSLARFQRGTRGELPENWLCFHDETEEVRHAYQASYIFTEQNTGGLRIEGSTDCWFLDIGSLRTEMRLNGRRQWRVRFADSMELDDFYERFGRGLDRHRETGAFGRWLNPLGRWDWWDLGGRFDGRIVGDRRSGTGRRVAQVSSGPCRGRDILANVENHLAEALGQEPIPLLDVQTDQNLELVATLLADARAGRENAYPGALVLPRGSVMDSLRWIDTWPELGPRDAITWLGLSPVASWAAIVSAAYSRFESHWAAGIAYHH